MDASSIITSGDGLCTATAFEQYVSGRRTLGAGAVFFVESGEHVEAVRSQTRLDDVVFAPAGSARRTDPRVVVYHGSLREPGDEITFDGAHAVGLGEYVMVPLLSIAGPTLIRQNSAEGVAAFLSDADTAKNSGVFIDALLSNAVLLDSLPSFLGPIREGEALARVHVTAEGEYRDGPDGLLLGIVGDGREEIEVRARECEGRGRGFARIVDRGVLEADLDDRPWFARYLAAIELLREGDGVPSRPTISGFGGHLVRALDELAALSGVVCASAPYLLTGDGDEWVLVDPPSRRRTRLGVDSARAAECLIATGDESAAVALLAAELGRGTSGVASMVNEVQVRFAAMGLDLTTSGRECLS
ncbi:daptide biosynthesis RiPP recognition protein [Microbacterium sp. NPDC091662]|uniref:daptide biosynthesis RiPP recognition protein n=1 Tax=Microbacterium sp. NPDC091662 TaxID=3364211 RepID=UPI0038076D7C